MIIRRASDRGLADHGWLRSFHTFSFGDYHDPANMGFRSLRVINEDRVQPGRGFGTHPHKDTKIISYVLEGELQHRDSMGTGSVVRPGEFQRMSAGTGVTHSEFNPSQDKLLHFLQIWIIPSGRGINPSYDQLAFPPEEHQGRLQAVASSAGRDGSMTIRADASLYAGVVGPEDKVTYTVPKGRHAWVHVVLGSVDLNGMHLSEDDAAGVSEPSHLASTGKGEMLIFDLA